MISLSRGDAVAGLSDLIVSSPSGEYADTDLILCARKDTPDFDTAMYQAQFIRYGEVVYQHETPEALGAALIAIDPESTHDAAQLWREDEARRLAREKGTLAPEDPTPAPDAIEPEPVTSKEDVAQEETDTTEVVEDTPEESPATPETPNEPPAEPEMPVIDAGEPPADPVDTGEVAGAATSTSPAIPIIQTEELPELPFLPEEPVVLGNTSTTTPQ